MVAHRDHQKPTRCRAYARVAAHGAETSSNTVPEYGNAELPANRQQDTMGVRRADADMHPPPAVYPAVSRNAANLSAEAEVGSAHAAHP